MSQKIPDLITTNNERRTVHLTDIDGSDEGSIQQIEAVNLFLKIAGLYKNSEGEFIEPITQGQECQNVMLVPGLAGTGKSFLIDCLVTEAIERYHEKTGIEGYILILAPTGKAALAVGGATLQSSQGLSVPTQKLESKETNIYKNGSVALTNLQRRLNYLGRVAPGCKHLIGVVMDEYSMLSSAQMYWLSSRLSQGVAYNGDGYFGGVPIAFFGDPGQLAPVGGAQLWAGKTSEGKPLGALATIGHQIYMKIQSVTWLTHVRRQKGEFREVLGRLRDGKNTEADWLYLNTHCALENFSPEKRLTFNSSETTWIYETNIECHKKNCQQLLHLRMPVCCIEAEHDSSSSARKSTEQCRRLASKLYLATGAKIMLLWNICTSKGLVNGSIGTLVDIIYKEGACAPSLPQFLIIEFPDYNGTPFFSGNGREKWIPLRPEQYDFENHYRKQFPISLSWALTAWKAQGLTCRTNVFAVIGDHEKSSGLTYVVTSRNTEVEQLCIGKALSLDRLTTEISKSKSLQVRLLEDNRLRELWRRTKTFYSRF